MIWTVCKDPRGVSTVLPVVHELRNRGREVQLFGNGKAIDILKSLEEPFKPYNSPKDLLLDSPFLPEVLITSMCGKGGVGRDLVPSLKDYSCIIALQDFWGGRLLTDWKNPIYRPHYICVNDQIGAKIVTKAWPDFKKGQIAITGYPALDKYSNYNVNFVRNETRERLGINGQKVILFAGQVKRTGEILSEVIDSINESLKNFYLIVREHPRMRQDAGQEIMKWESSLHNLKKGILINTTEFNISSAIAAADIILGAFSTILVEGAVLRKEVISVLYEDQGMAQFLEDTGGLMDEYPLVKLGCAVKVTNREQLKEKLKQAMGNGLGLQNNQAKYFRLDGKNAERVCDLIESNI